VEETGRQYRPVLFQGNGSGPTDRGEIMPAKETNRIADEDNLPPFEEIFRLHHRRVYAMCLRMTGNVTEAEDLCQEVFIQLFRKRDTFRGESTFKTWLHRVTVNHVLMHFRKRRCRKEDLTTLGELPDPLPPRSKISTSFPVLDRLALDEALVKLAPGYRIVLVLHDVEGLQHFEIASLLGCSVGTTKSQLHKARLRMRKLLREKTPAPRSHAQFGYAFQQT
jgi:RNA polymerase sigma-70 factor (ECF subfamily)